MPVQPVRVFAMGGYSPDESMIDSSPFLWAVKLVEGWCSMRKATRRRHKCNVTEGGDEKTWTGDLTPLPYRNKQSQKKTRVLWANMREAIKNAPQQHARTCVCTTPNSHGRRWWHRTNNQPAHPPTLVPPVPSHRSLNHPVLLPPLPRQRELPPCPLHDFHKPTYQNSR